jgi:hypothetical protein
LGWGTQRENCGDGRAAFDLGGRMGCL